jgi:uncharacterized integral membrane protein
MNSKKVIIIAVVVLLVILFFQNTHTVVFHLFFWKISMPLIILLPIVFIAGGVVGFFGKKFLSS